MEPTYQVIFRGKLLTGFSAEVVSENVAKLFRTEPSRIAAMLKQSKLVLKTGISKATAQQYQEALRAAGMMVAVMADEPSAAPTPTAAPASTAAVASPVAQAEVSGDTADTDAPLDNKPAAPRVEIDTSHLSLADVGVVIGELPRNPNPAPIVVPASLSLAAPGVVLVEAKPVPRREVDTSGLSLEPVKIVEKPLSALVREAG